MIRIAACRRVNVQGGHEHDAVKQAGSDDGGLLKVLPGKELNLGELKFPNVEEEEEHDTENLHGDNVARGPLLGGVGRKTEGEEEEHKGGGDDEQADHYFDRISAREPTGGRKL